MDFLVRWKNTIKHSVNTVAVGSVAYIHFALPAGSKAGAILAGKAGAGAAAVSATFTGAAAVIASAAAAAVPPVAIGVGLTVLSYKFGKWVKSTRKSEKAKPDSVEPFPFGDGRPNESFMSFRYFATESADPGNNEFILTWTEKEESVLNQSQGGPEKRQGKDDKDPDCRDCIPSTPEDIKQLHALIKTLSELLRNIRRNEPTLLQSPSKSEIFAMLLDLLTKLIHTHGAVFQRSEAGIRLIPFRIDQVRALVQNPPDLFFDQPIRDFFSTMLTPINDSNETLNAFMNIKGLIYCIQCQICQQPNVFNYVGQTVQLVAKRGGKHYRVIKKNAGHLLHSHLLDKHGITNIKGILSEAYKIYLVHDLSNNATSPRADPSCERGTDKRIRRSWEMFYQWLYRAMDFDGGGCHM